MSMPNHDLKKAFAFLKKKSGNAGSRRKEVEDMVKSMGLLPFGAGKTTVDNFKLCYGGRFHVATVCFFYILFCLL